MDAILMKKESREKLKSDPKKLRTFLEKERDKTKEDKHIVKLF